MAKINGDWFHSRSSSNLDELLAVRTLVLESQKPEYFGFGWSGGRHGNLKMYNFAHTVGIEPSTMQTKIRAMIRYGFVKDGNTCPITFTRIGQLWNDLFSVGNFEGAKKLYQITLTISLAIYAFNESRDGFSLNPAKGDLPLKFLLKILENDSISLKEFDYLVDGNTSRVGKNTSYWKRDLLNAGIFYESNGKLIYTGIFPKFINEIANFEPNPLLSDDDWQEIRENPLIDKSPFKESLKQIFLDLADINEIEAPQIEAENLTEPLIDIISDIEDIAIPEIDIISTGTQIIQTNRRVRSSIWSKRVKREYNHSCIIPNCDVSSESFVVAAHIKPDAVEDEEIPHRTHILNGLCMCYHCHIAFDKGFISIEDDYKLIISDKFNRIPDQHFKRMILSSKNINIKERIDGRKPIIDFVRYHRTKIFKP